MDFIKKYFSKNNIPSLFTIENRFFSISLFIIIAVGIILRLHLFSCNFSFWGDEIALGYNIINLKYIELFNGLELNQAAPPFFTFLSKLILDISHQTDNIQTRELVLRVLPLLSGILTLPFFAYCVYKLSNNKIITIFSVLILSLNRLAVNYSGEFKQYEIELLFSIILIILFSSLDYKNCSNKNIFYNSLIISTAPWFSYSSVFYIVSGLIIALFDIIKNKLFSKLKALLFFIPILSSFVLFYFHYKKASALNYSYMMNYWTKIDISIFTKDNFFILFKQRINYLFDFYEPNLTLLIFILMFMVFIFKNDFKKVFLISFPIVLCTISAFYIYPFRERLILFLLPSFIIILSQFGHFIKKTSYSTNNIMMVLFSIFAFFALFTPIEKYRIYRYDMISAIPLIIKEAKQGDVIITELPLINFYLKSIQDILDKKEYDYKTITDDIINSKSNTIWLLLPPVSDFSKNEILKLVDEKNYKKIELTENQKPHELFWKITK